MHNLISLGLSNSYIPTTSSQTKKKTTYTTFYPSTHPDIHLSFNNTKLKQEPTTKLLGILIQNNLKFHQNVTNTIKKLHPHIHTFRYINKILPTETMLQLYHSYIYSIIIYALPIWGSHRSNSTYLQPLHKTHKKIIRLICNKRPQTPTKPLFHQLQILNIFNLYIYRTAIDMHPFIHPPTEELNRPTHNHQYHRAADIHQHSTRFATSQSLYIPNTNQYLAEYQPSHSIDHYAKKFSHLWNNIPHNIRSIPNIKTFKATLKQHLQTIQDEKLIQQKKQKNNFPVNQGKNLKTIT
jgi:hypothetical protein